MSVEYHGWINLRQAPAEVEDDRLPTIAAAVQGEIARIQAPHRILGMRAVNGNYFIWLAGCTNHWATDVDEALGLFKFVALAAPGSYGLLFLWNDEGPQEPTNAFRVWKLARGALTEHADPFLSPCIPTIEDTC